MVKVDFLGVPIVSEVVGSKSISVDFSGKTVIELIEYITRRYGRDVRAFLLDETGSLDMSIQVLLNGKEWIRREDMSRFLNDGDVVRIMMLVGGG